MEKTKNVKKQEISDKTAIKAFINGFISYGFLLFFIFIMLICFFGLITGFDNPYTNFTRTISNAIIIALMIYFTSLFLCRISTYDVLKKCKIKSKSIKNITDKMKLFFIGCAVFSLILSIFIVYLNFNNNVNYITKTTNNYYASFTGKDKVIADALSNELINSQKEIVSNYTISVSIIESTILVSCFYLIFYQRKMILVYNK